MPEPQDDFHLGSDEGPPCRWCGGPSTVNAQIEHGRAGKSIRMVRQEPVCDDHYQMILRNRQELIDKKEKAKASR